MFDLENAIASWRAQMLAAGVKTPVPLEELESHLREDIEQQTSSGIPTPDAFSAAAQRIGRGDVLHQEFKRAGGLLEPLLTAPPQILAYIVFVVGVTLVDYGTALFGPATFRASVVPYTGWVASMFYAYTIFFAFALMYQQVRRGANRTGITCLLLLQIAFGLFDLFKIGAPNFDNPYLTISPWRFVWTVLIPCFWIAVLYMPHMNRFCADKPKTQSV